MKRGSIWQGLLVSILLVPTSSTAQLNFVGGVGFSYSSHADSYIEEEFFKTVEFSGFRTVVFEARVDYRFPTETFLYASYRLSPRTSSSPYRFSFFSVGIEQVVPNTPLFITTAYGINKASTDIRLSEGNLILFGLGIKSEIMRVQFSGVFGDQENTVPFLSDKEKRYTLALLFNLFNHG